MHGYGSLRVLSGLAIVIGLSAGRADGQSGTIVYEWVASLPDVETRGEMAEVGEVLAALRNMPFVLHFTPAGSLMVKDTLRRPGYVSPATFRATYGNLDDLVRVFDAVYAVEPNVLHLAYVGEDGSGVKVLRSMDGEMHRVDAGVAPVAWRITGEQRARLGYRVTRAVGEFGGDQAEAWFAPDIPVSGGPGLHGGLPGMILVLSLNGGRITYAATEVSLNGMEDEVIRMPEVGEARTAEEYRSMVATQIRQVRQTVRGMVRAYREVECTVGSRGSQLRCLQSR